MVSVLGTHPMMLCTQESHLAMLEESYGIPWDQTRVNCVHGKHSPPSTIILAPEASILNINFLPH